MLHKFLQPNILSICKQCVSRTNVHHHRRCISFIAKATPNPFAFKFEALEDIDDVFNKYLSFCIMHLCQGNFQRLILLRTIQA